MDGQLSLELGLAPPPAPKVRGLTYDQRHVLARVAVKPATVAELAAVLPWRSLYRYRPKAHERAIARTLHSLAGRRLVTTWRRHDTGELVWGRCAGVHVPIP